MSLAAASKLSAHSADTAYTALDVLLTPPTNTSIAHAEDTLILPTAGGSLEDAFDFIVPGNTAVYTDLKNSTLEVDVKVVQRDGTALDATAANLTVWPGDNYAHSLFEKVTIRIGEADVEYASNYGTRAFIDNLLNFSKEEKKSTLVASSGWSEDAALCGHGDANAAAVLLRKDGIKGSATNTFFMKLRMSLAECDRLLAPGLNLSIKFHRSPAAYSLMAAGDDPAGGARVQITRAVLHLRRAVVNDAVFNAQLAESINGATFKYPIDRVKTYMYSADTGSFVKNIVLDQNPQRPNRVVIGIVDAAAHAPKFDRNANAYEPFDLASIELRPTDMGEGIRFDTNFTSGTGLARAYAKLAMLVDRYDTGLPFGVTFKEWKTKCTLYGFDFAPDLQHNNAFHLFRNGHLTLNIRFRSALAKRVTIVVYQEFDDLIEIDAAHKVKMIGQVL
jgi:hypothetical protein